MDYFDWLKGVKNPEVIKVLNDENDYFSSYFTSEDHKLKNELVEEFKTKIEEDSTSMEIIFGQYAYFTRTAKGENYKLYLRKHLESGIEEILLNANERAKDHSYFSVEAQKISPHLKKIAWCFDIEGSGKSHVEIQDLETKTFSKTDIENVPWGKIEWGQDSECLFYTQPNQAWRVDSIWLYKSNKISNKSENKNHQRVFFEPNELFNVGLSKTSDSKFVLFSSSSFNHSQYFYYLDQKVLPIYTTTKDVLAHVDHSGKGFVVCSNHCHKNYGLYLLEKVGAELNKAIELVKPSEKAKLSEFFCVQDKIVYCLRNYGIDEVYVLDKNELDQNVPTRLVFDEEIYNVYLKVDGLPGQCLIDYSSPIRPNKGYVLDVKTKKLILKKETKAPSLNSNLYKTELRHIPARDGQMVPIHLTYRRDLDLQVPHRVLLYGYGSYSYTVPSNYMATVFSLLDRNFIYVNAHVRGCDANGENWYEAGKMLNKQNTFHDFVDISEYLIREKLTTPSQLAIEGASAGGLLVGATINQKPENFRAAIALVPFVDALTTMLDPTLPLTTQEYLQWGDPNQKNVYDYIKAYSPYDNIRPGITYPAIFSRTGIHDLQVSYREPLKWIQKLRDLTLNTHPYLLRINMSAGHGGASGRYHRFEETGEKYVFLLKELGQ